MIDLLLGDLMPYIIGLVGLAGAAFGLYRKGGNDRDRKRELEDHNRKIATRKEIHDALAKRDPAAVDPARERLRDHAK